MREELNKCQSDLRTAYAAGNQANTNVAHAKQNLAAAEARWANESKIESEATLNLEKARAEEALAKLALDELIASYSSALPYAIVPNGNGAGAGSPSGNNPSGSPLGPATQGTSAIAITNWSSYLSNAFGRGINPTLDGNINYLYPFTFTGATTNPSVCQGSGPVRAITGTIVEVGQGHILIEAEGRTYQINIGTCSNMTSNVAGHTVTTGDQVIAKGTQSGSNSMNCQQGIVVA